LEKEKQRKRALVVSIGGNDAQPPVVSRLQPRTAGDRVIALGEHQRRDPEDEGMEKLLNPEHVVLYAEFRKGGCKPSAGVIEQFDQITKDMLTSARSTQTVASLIRADLGLPELA